MATIRDIAEVLIKIDDKEAKTKMPELKKQAEEIIKTWEECFKNDDQKGLKEAGKELRKVYREMDNLQKRTMDVDEAMQHLSTAAPKELKRIMERHSRKPNIAERDIYRNGSTGEVEKDKLQGKAVCLYG